MNGRSVLRRAALRPDSVALALSRTLALKPALILFDEPTRALGPQAIDAVLGAIKELAHGGMTMIVVTREMGFAKVAADRVVMMHDGRITEAGPPEHFFLEPHEPRTREFLSQIV